MKKIDKNQQAKGDSQMVNENFEKFREVQKKHQGVYIGGATNAQTPGLNDENYNNQEDTDKSVGATGRKI
jgi:hypothetical protein